MILSKTFDILPLVGRCWPLSDAIAMIISEREFSLTLSGDWFQRAALSVSWCLTRASICAESNFKFQTFLVHQLIKNPDGTSVS